MNINIFLYLQDKKGKPIPFEYKLLNSLPLTNDELIIDGYLDLRWSKITSLPNNLTVNYWLNIYSTNISELPEDLYIGGNLWISSTNIFELPEDLYVGGNLFCKSTPLGNKIINDLSLLEKYSKQVKGEIFYEY